MKRALLVLTLLAGLATPASASAVGYDLSDNGASTPTLLVTPGDQSSIAIKYTSVCLLIGCNSGVTISAADDATPINDLTTTVSCTSNTAASWTCNVPLGSPTSVTGTSGDDSVTGVCESSSAGTRNSPLIFNAGDGNDVVDNPTCTGSSVSLGSGDDRAVISGFVQGNMGNDVLTGGPGADTLDGGRGNDLLIGGGGPDTLFGSIDTDTASYQDRGPAQPVTVTLDGVRNDGAPGENDLVASDVENVTGGAGNDTLIGDAGSNVLSGGSGNDTIDGRGGIDFLDGGAGDDTLLARDGQQDRVSCGEGNDHAVVDAFDSVDGCESVDSSRALMPDVDADGVPAPADCNDHNPSIRPGFRDIPGNGIDEDCSGSDAPFARVLTSIQSLFTFGPVTRFTQLKARGVPERATVELRCGGGRKRGCFGGVRRFRFPKGADTADIRKPVRRSSLRPGARLEIRVLAPESIGKVVRFTARKGKPPKQAVLCLAPGASKPRRCGR